MREITNFFTICKKINPIKLSTFQIGDEAQLKRADSIPSSTLPSKVMFPYNTSTWEEESGWSQVQEQSKLQRVPETSSKKLIQKQNKTKQKTEEGWKKGPYLSVRIQCICGKHSKASIIRKGESLKVSLLKSEGKRYQFFLSLFNEMFGSWPVE